MSDQPPEVSGKNHGKGDAGHDTRILHIDNLHLHANEIDSLKRLAEVSPDLASLVVEQKDKFDRREHASYRLGILAATSIVISVSLGFLYVIINIGLLQSVIFILFVVVVSALVRVIINGEWSDTSWIGKTVQSLIQWLGGTGKADSKPD